MKRAFITTIAGFFLLVAAPALADSFPSFDQKISVDAQSGLVVRETVTVNFDVPRHGIFRNIPVEYRTSSGNPFSIQAVISSVADELGNPVPYSLSRSGNDLVVKIGDPEKTVRGRQVYVIDYSVDRALLFLEDQDQLYWNVIVEPWENLGLPEKVSAHVSLPPGIAAAGIATRCFIETGSSQDGGCLKASAESGADFSAQGTPLTIVVGWPKGYVSAPTWQTRLGWWVADNGIIIWPVIVFVAMFLLWYKKGRDPKVTGSIVVEYEPPEGVSPAELGALVKSSVGKEEVTATIVDLAVRGYLTIEEKNGQGLFGKSSSYSFRLANADRNGLKPHEERLLDGIFGSGAAVGEETELSELQNKFYRSAEEAKGSVFGAVVDRGWFSKSPRAVRGFYIGIAGFYAFGVIFLGGNLLANGTVWFVSLFLPALIIAVFGYFMPSRTMKGTASLAKALGFREFLSKAEKYRLKWEEKQNIFDKFLPYAMIFGVADKWAKAFEGILNNPPSWYHGAVYANWTPLLFLHNLDRATSTFNNVMFTAPSSKGGGGFGGGGFGGGGFGGGGGGSW